MTRPNAPWKRWRQTRGGRGGKTGIDMYWPGKLDGCADEATQHEAFAWHIDLAKRVGKPLMMQPGR